MSKNNFILIFIILFNLTLVAESSRNVSLRHKRRNLPIKEAISKDTLPPKKCFVCPPNQTLLANEICNCSVLRHPVVQPCHHSTNMRNVRVKIIKGPTPGTLVSEGSYQTVLRIYDQGIPVHTCRYTSTVSRGTEKQCPSLNVTAVKVNCSLANHLGSTCTFSCARGFQISGSATSHCIQQPNGQFQWTQSPPKCSKTLHVTKNGDCRDVNVTLEHGEEIVLPVPKFKFLPGSANVTCTLDKVRQTGVFQRTCNAVHLPSRKSSSCTYLVNVVQGTKHCHPIPAPRNGSLTCATQNATVICSIQCDPEHSITITELKNQNFGKSDVIFCHDRLWRIGKHQVEQPVIICERDPPGMDFVAELSFKIRLKSCDPALVDQIWRNVRSGLLAKNADACEIANCTKFEQHCSSDLETNALDAAVYMEVTWTVTANYFPLEDYYYEGAEVPEAEILIEKIQVRTAQMIKADSLFHGETKKHGGNVIPESFRIGMLDLVCQLQGYVVDQTTNKCRKCPAGTYQDKAACKPCPQGFFQDLPGQASCQKCRNKNCDPAGEEILEHGIHLRHHNRKKVAELKAKNIKKQRYVSRIALKSNQTKLEEDPCIPNPCMAGGTCFRISNEARCKCALGFTGSHCEIPQCPALYCFHGGTCLMKHSVLSCNCPPGFKGKRCELTENSEAKSSVKKRRHQKVLSAVDPRFGYCASNPCRNGGRCVDNSHAGYFSCKCVGRFHGPTCELRGPCLYGNCDTP